jgi:hypothetical protein
MTPMADQLFEIIDQLLSWIEGNLRLMSVAGGFLYYVFLLVLTSKRNFET